MAVPIARGTASRDGGTSNIVVASFTPAANAFMIALVVTGGDPDSLTGHDAGNSWTKIATNQVHNSGATLSLWGAHAGASPSASTLTVANSTDVTLAVMLAEVPSIDVSGTVLNSILDDQGNTGNSTTASTPALAATSDLTMGYFFNTNSYSWTVENAALENMEWYIANYLQLASDYAESGDTTHTATIGTADYWAAIAVSFKLAAVGGSTGKSNPLMGCLGGCLSGVIA